MAKQPGNLEPQDRLRWLTARNVYAGVIPAFGLVKVSEVDADGTLQVTRPDADGQDVYVNGPVKIVQGGYGNVTRDWPAFALYTAADGTPTNGDTWGAKSGDFTLRKGFAGFTIEGGVNAGLTIVLTRGRAASAKAAYINFTLPSALAATDASKATCTVNSYWGGGANPGSSVTVYNQAASSNYIFAAGSGKHGVASYDPAADKYRIINMECP
jgi:hypothetical protein